MSALHDASVDVYEFIESNYVNIRAECGEVKTQQIKTENLSIHTVSGDVLCQGSLQVAKSALILNFIPFTVSSYTLIIFS